MKVLIIEDEEKIRALLIKKVESLLESATVVGEAGSVDEGIAKIKELNPEIVFLDINLIEGSGFDILDAFPNPDFEVIFITAYDQYAIEAFRFSAIDYLLKPVENDRLIAAYHKAREEKNTKNSLVKWKVLKENIKEGPKKLFLHTTEGVEFIDICKIIRIEADRRYSKIIMENGSDLLASKNLKEFEDLLGQKAFMRIHNSHIINLNFVVRLKTKVFKVMLSNKEEIEISRRKKDEFLQRTEELFNSK